MRKFMIVLGSAVVASQAFAGITAIGSRADIAKTDEIRWEDKGPTGTFLGGSFVVATHGTPFDVHVQGSNMSRTDMGNPWFSGFDNGEPLLYNEGRLTLTGAKTCSDVGLDIDANPFGAFVAHMAAYDGLGTYMGEITASGVSGTGGKTPFIGVHSDLGDIHKVVLWVTQNDQAVSFAVDHVSYRCCGPVPEPASLAVLGLGAGALLRRKSKKA